MWAESAEDPDSSLFPLPSISEDRGHPCHQILLNWLPFHFISLLCSIKTMHILPRNANGKCKSYIKKGNLPKSHHPGLTCPHAPPASAELSSTRPPRAEVSHHMLHLPGTPFSRSVVSEPSISSQAPSSETMAVGSHFLPLLFPSTGFRT